MIAAEVEARVARISQMHGDYEAAHSEEDSLYRDVLIAIANGTAPHPDEVARAALATFHIDFPRFCA